MTVRDLVLGKSGMVTVRVKGRNYLCTTTEAMMVFGHLTVKRTYTNSTKTLTLSV